MAPEDRGRKMTMDYREYVERYRKRQAALEAFPNIKPWDYQPLKIEIENLSQGERRERIEDFLAHRKNVPLQMREALEVVLEGPLPPDYHRETSGMSEKQFEYLMGLMEQGPTSPFARKFFMMSDEIGGVTSSYAGRLIDHFKEERKKYQAIKRDINAAKGRKKKKLVIEASLRYLPKSPQDAIPVKDLIDIVIDVLEKGDHEDEVGEITRTRVFEILRDLALERRLLGDYKNSFGYANVCYVKPEFNTMPEYGSTGSNESDRTVSSESERHTR